MTELFKIIVHSNATNSYHHWHGSGLGLSNAKRCQNNENIKSEEVGGPPSQVEILNCQLLSTFSLTQAKFVSFEYFLLLL